MHFLRSFCLSSTYLTLIYISILPIHCTCIWYWERIVVVTYERIQSFLNTTIGKAAYIMCFNLFDVSALYCEVPLSLVMSTHFTYIHFLFKFHRNFQTLHWIESHRFWYFKIRIVTIVSFGDLPDVPCLNWKTYYLLEKIIRLISPSDVPEAAKFV